MFEGRNLRFTKEFRMCFVMNRLRFVSRCGYFKLDLLVDAVKRLTDVRRTKSEVYEGFSHVFCDESTQISKTKVFLRAGQMAEFDGCRTKVLSYTT
ncbi:hypothetical protein HanXRQr2_Chr05g0226101 [Helianthus annuus]|uniref:Uncharacterized protein n=1 Tax=Helianthus annuus TaxID=4232 RepID=A0A9K3J1W4_HELAN|nr:hypothetical protein HanXRQr2_Chr05g0226101 [Helianthus annuus]